MSNVEKPFNKCLKVWNACNVISMNFMPFKDDLITSEEPTSIEI